MKQTIYMKKNDLESERVLDETLILSLNSGLFFKLNLVASDIWEMVDGNSDVENIMKSLSERYDINSEILKQDVYDFFKDAESKEFIEKR